MSPGTLLKKRHLLGHQGKNGKENQNKKCNAFSAIASNFE
jgi:hypothetical protein